MHDWHACEPREVIVAEDFKVSWADGSGESSKGAGRPDGDSLSNRMIMISANNRLGMLADPVDAGDWIRRVIDDITKEQAGIEAFVDGSERRPVGVDVGEEEDAHVWGGGFSVRRECGILPEILFRRFGS